MFISKGFGRLHFEHKRTRNQKISHEESKFSSILIKNPYWLLLKNVDSGFSQTVRKCVFVNLLKVAVAMIDVNRISRLTNQSTKFFNPFLHLCSLRSLWLFPIG